MKVLSGLAPFDHPWVTGESAPMEDAALLRPKKGSTLVFTVDFITPIVDDPHDFGAIAAANALSDVYAMGGEPQVALAICGYPDDKLSLEDLERIFRGGRDKAAEAGCAIVGGHTVIDPELKYGLCVLGMVDPQAELSQGRARPGDRLLLTKPIGSGIAAQGLKKGKLSERETALLVSVLSTLNRDAKDAALAAGVRAATDVTGFGLLGHMHNLALGAGCGARVDARSVPRLPFLDGLLAEGIVPGGTHKNLSFVEPHTRWDGKIPETERWLLCDAQTSGGLLLAVPPERVEAALRGLESRKTPAASLIGELIEAPPGTLEVH